MAISYPGGQDTFTTRVAGDTITPGHVNDLQDAIELLEKRLGITGDEIIVATTKILIYANTAPANWTIDDGVNDKLVFVTKGSVAGGQTGGQPHTTGTWTQPEHQLTIAEMPAHEHDIKFGGPAAGGGAGGGGVATGYALVDGACETVGGDGVHSHGNEWRPAAYNYICCTKDTYPTT